VLCLERGEPGGGQSAGDARGFRHLHADPEKLALAVEARAAWDAWSARAGERLVGEEGALRLGGDAAADAARLRAAGVPADALAVHGGRHAALRPDVSPLLWDPRGGAIRARRAVGALAAWLAGRLRREDVRAVAPGRVTTGAGAVACGHVIVCAGAGVHRLLPRAPPLRRVVHLRLTFPAPAGPLATWADRSRTFDELTYGVQDGPGRYALGLADLDAQPAPADPHADGVPAGTDLAEMRRRIVAYARAAFPGLEPEPVDEVVRLLTVLSTEDEDAFALHREDGVTALVGHNLFKLAPVLGERLADVVA
jgi:sarcosine oxidase